MENRIIIHGFLSKEKVEKTNGEIYLRSQFLYDHDSNELILHIWDETRSFYLDMVQHLNTNDKIALLAAINKDNNRIKNMMEESKTREYKTDSLRPYYDEIRSKEIKDGIEWQYVKDGKVEQTAFMSYKQLYEIQIGKESTTKCHFCDNMDTIEFMPREQDSSIRICRQHQEYIKRIFDRNSITPDG